MCPATAELENGDPESPVEFLCEVAHLRAVALGLKVPTHGACDFCNGGSREQQVTDAARAIRSREIDVDSWSSPPLLPVLNNSRAHSGCGDHCGSRAGELRN
jgi:hypothetical protein